MSRKNPNDRFKGTRLERWLAIAFCVAAAIWFVSIFVGGLIKYANGAYH